MNCIKKSLPRKGIGFRKDEILLQMELKFRFPNTFFKNSFVRAAGYLLIFSTTPVRILVAENPEPLQKICRISKRIASGTTTLGNFASQMEILFAVFRQFAFYPTCFQAVAKCSFT
jgi:hypothetical protein